VLVPARHRVRPDARTHIAHTPTHIVSHTNASHPYLTHVMSHTHARTRTRARTHIIGTDTRRDERYRTVTAVRPITRREKPSRDGRATHRADIWRARADIARRGVRVLERIRTRHATSAMYSIELYPTSGQTRSGRHTA
jgi:hypothetical protein